VKDLHLQVFSLLQLRFYQVPIVRRNLNPIVHLITRTMKTLVTLTIVTMAISNSIFASSEVPAPVNFPAGFTSSLKKSGKFSKNSKVCSCQVLRVASNNEKDKMIAVFAEATNTGDLSSRYSSAGAVLEKEKKHLKHLFYDKMEMAEQVSTPMPCDVLYRNLQVKYENIRLLSVLDVDALALVQSAKK